MPAKTIKDPIVTHRLPPPIRDGDDDGDTPSLNEGLASTGIVFHRHQLKRMASALPSPGALKNLASSNTVLPVDDEAHESATPRVLRPEPKKITDETSPDSGQSYSKEFDEENYKLLDSKEYSDFQYYLDIGRRSTTTSGPGEDALFLFEDQGCYEEVIDGAKGGHFSISDTFVKH